MDLDEYLAKLRQVLSVRRDLFVIARTDSTDPDDIARRVRAFSEAGADAVLVDGVTNLKTVRQLAKTVRKPFCFNQIAGGKSPPFTLGELSEAGVKIAIYSTPCLFPVQAAIEKALDDLRKEDGSLSASPVGVKDCTKILSENLARRSAPQVQLRPAKSS